MERVGLVGCVATKRRGAAPARDLYTSALFRGRRRFVERSCDRWYVLSALHGLIPPDTVIESYDVALEGAGRRERAAWAERVLAQLRAELGDLARYRFEIHAGAAYRDNGLVAGIRRAGALVDNPAEGLNQGQQRAYYKRDGQQPPRRSTHRTAPSAPAPVPAAPPMHTRATFEVLEIYAVLPFTHRWPDVVEEFALGWDLLVRFGGVEHRVRFGMGWRACFGRERHHCVVWVDGRPMVEGAEAEDFPSTRSLVSVLKEYGGNHDARSLGAVDPEYASFDVVVHRDAIHGPDARRGLAVRLREDDLAGWAHHAVLRERSKRGGARVRSDGTVEGETPAGPASGPANDAQAVVAALLEYAATLVARQGGAFTPDAAADAFVEEDPFAFLVAVICDEQVRFEAAWEAPALLRTRLGHWVIARIANEPRAVREAFRQRPALHRWVTNTPRRVVAAAQRVLAEYNGEAGRIWGDRPSARVLRARFERFEGIGQKKAAMAVELLERELGVLLDALDGSDVAVDVHVRRVFLRSGLVAEDTASSMVEAARALHPERPGALDQPAWEIGRNWCRPRHPRCGECPIRSACPRLIDRANDVRGA